MKRTFTNLISCLFIGFLLIGVVCVAQNIVQDVQRTIHYSSKTHVLAYQIES